MIRLAAALLALAGVVSLAACGRAGPPRVPGPKEAVIYPRAYPQYPPQPAPQAAPPAPSTPAMPR
jgi:predicted small lipoprotein YifL